MGLHEAVLLSGKKGPLNLQTMSLEDFKALYQEAAYQHHMRKKINSGAQLIALQDECKRRNLWDHVNLRPTW